jgi:hypothetical protein
MDMREGRCPICCELLLIPIPDYETPEQYEKRTGKPVSDDMAVWWRCKSIISYLLDTWCWSSWSVDYYRNVKNMNDIQVIIADPPVPPPGDWMPEEEKP